MAQDPATALAVADIEENGFHVVRGGLSPAEVDSCRIALNEARANGWEEGLNHVGNMWFDSLLDRMPDVFGPLVGHRSVRPILEAMYGPQCQLRSLRGHINPGPYRQEWHLDFYGYWRQQDAAPYASRATGINTTFYFQDNGPGVAGLAYVRNGHRIEPPDEVVRRYGSPASEDLFNEWADSLEHVTIYPKAGDVVVFFSHIPHRGYKDVSEVERSNVVCHYQNNPFYESIPHVSVLQPHSTFPIGLRQ